MIGIIWPIWTLGGFFHTVLSGGNIHAVHYCRNSIQIKYLFPHLFNRPLNIPYDKIAIHMVVHKNSHARRIGGIISDGCFEIVLSNGRFDVIK